MAWDSEAKLLAIKAIGTVESNLKYDVIYYADAITIGIIQWYAGRAVNLLNQLTGSPLWAGVASSLKASLASHPSPTADWSWWSNRYLTRDEGNSLKPLLVSDLGVSVQNAQIITDLNEYEVTASAAGLNPHTNTNAFIYWCVMHHQSPKQAKRILSVAGINPSLERFHSLALNNQIFRKYPSRYNKARAIILSGDTSGVPSMGTEVSEEEDDGEFDDDIDAGQSAGGIRSVRRVGSSLHIYTSTGVVVCQPTGTNLWVAGIDDSSNGAGPGIVPDGDNSAPEIPPSSSDAGAKRAAVVKWMVEREGTLHYSQGAGRMNSDVSGVGDCSSTVYQAYYRAMGIKLGANTEGQMGGYGGRPGLPKPGDGVGQTIWHNHNGPTYTAPPTSIMLPGDLIYYIWKSGDNRVRHVEMYVGSNQITGHGSRGVLGPTRKNHTSNGNKAWKCYVKRVIF